MQRENAFLQQEVEETVRTTQWAERLQSVEIDPNNDSETPFIRVNLRIRGADKLSADDLIALQRAIEDRLIPLDDRFPSVRFAESAK